MTTSVQDLANKIVTDLNTASFSQSFTAEFTRRPLTTIQEVDESIKVFVVPTSRFSVVESRAVGRDEYSVEVGVVTRVDDVDRTELEVFTLLDEIWEHFKRRHLPNAQPIEYHWSNTNQDFIYDYEDLDHEYTVKSVFTLSYKVWK